MPTIPTAAAVAVTTAGPLAVAAAAAAVDFFFAPHSDGNSRRTEPQPAEKFAARYDGLRFIETLVTAHR